MMIVTPLIPAIDTQMKALERKAAETLWTGTPLLKGLFMMLRDAFENGEIAVPDNGDKDRENPVEAPINDTSPQAPADVVERTIEAAIEEWMAGKPKDREQPMSRLIAARLVASRPITDAESDEGYKKAWQEIADLLDIPAQSISPRRVHEEQVMPTLRRMLSNT